MMLPFTSGRKDESRGQSLVEFTLVAPFLFVLLLGIFEAGRFVLYQQTLNSAAREGARYAIVHGARGDPQVGPLASGVPELEGWDETGATVQETVEDAAIGMLDTDRLAIDLCWQTGSDRAVPTRSTDCTEGNNNRGSPVTVWVDYDYDPILRDLLGFSFLPTITISVESTYVINN